jgi:hypothetical protein
MIEVIRGGPLNHAEVKRAVDICMARVMEANGDQNQRSRELSIVITKLQEAGMWLDEDLKLKNAAKELEEANAETGLEGDGGDTDNSTDGDSGETG